MIAAKGAARQIAARVKAWRPGCLLLTRFTAHLVTDSLYGGDHTLPGQIACTKRKRREKIMLGTILIVLLILMLIGALPTWPHSRNWGYYPTGGIGVVVVIVVILVLLGEI
jgi:hypothetical protein